MEPTSLELGHEPKPVLLETVKDENGEEWVEDSTHRAEKAARYVAFQESLTNWETIKMYRTATAWILFGLLGVWGFGIDSIAASGFLAMPQFREDFGELLTTTPYPIYVVPAYWISIYTAAGQAGGMIGAFAAGVLADKIGRRYTNFVFCSTSLVGVGLQFAARGSLPLLTVGKFINGIAIYSWIVIGPLYTSEVAPLRIRGWLLSSTSFTIYAGTLFFTGIMYKVGPVLNSSSYQITFACQWGVPALLLLGMYWWPESPVWLIKMGKRDAAMKSIERLYSGVHGANMEGVLAQIEETIAHENGGGVIKKVGVKECFQKTDRQRTLVTIFVYCCQYLSGIVFVIGYQTYYYQIIGYSAQTSFLFSMLTNALMLLCYPLSCYLINSLGRRPLIVWGQLAASVWLFVIGGLSLSTTGPAAKGQVAMIFLWIFTFQVSTSNITWILGGEIPSLRLRAQTQALASSAFSFAAWLMSFCFPYMLNPDAGNLSGKVGFIFGGITLVGFAGCFFWVPETKGRPTEEIDLLYEKGIAPRDFGKTDVATL